VSGRCAGLQEKEQHQHIRERERERERKREREREREHPRVLEIHTTSENERKIIFFSFST
jgi:hypothetical protein